MIVVDASDDIEKDNIENAYLEIFDDIKGIEYNLRVVTEDEVTLRLSLIHI